jgi:hypothetical protein
VVSVYGIDPQPRAHLHGRVTHVHFSLEAGTYTLAFRLSDNSVLAADFERAIDETGRFRVGRKAIDLGTVRPSGTWLVMGD